MSQFRVRDTLIVAIDVSFNDEATTWERVYAGIIAGVYKISAPSQVPFDIRNVRIFVEE